MKQTKNRTKQIHACVCVCMFVCVSVQFREEFDDITYDLGKKIYQEIETYHRFKKYKRNIILKPFRKWGPTQSARIGRKAEKQPKKGDTDRYERGQRKHSIHK